MVTFDINCYMTSEDAQELADRLRYLEKNAIWGASLEAKTWKIPGNIPVEITFTVDQDRATNKGLMKPY